MCQDKIIALVKPIIRDNAGVRKWHCSVFRTHWLPQTSDSTSSSLAHVDRKAWCTWNACTWGVPCRFSGIPARWPRLICLPRRGQRYWYRNGNSLTWRNWKKRFRKLARCICGLHGQHYFIEMILVNFIWKSNVHWSIFCRKLPFQSTSMSLWKSHCHWYLEVASKDKTLFPNSYLVWRTQKKQKYK